MPHSTNESVQELIEFEMRRAVFDFCSERDIGQLASAAIEVVSQDLEDARMFRWICLHATISWDSTYENAVVCFPLKADFFETIEDAVRKAMGEGPKDYE